MSRSWICSKDITAGTLYDRLGGVFSIASIIDHFSDAIVKNDVVGVNSQNPFLRDWHRNHLDRLPGLKFMRTLWVCSIAGGPYIFMPSRPPSKCPFDAFNLSRAHSDFKMKIEEFEEVAKLLTISLEHFGVPIQEKNEVLGVFAAHMGDIVRGGPTTGTK